MDKYLLRAAAFLWGSATLVVFHVQALLTRNVRTGDTDADIEHLRETQHKIWALDGDHTSAGLKHNFIKLRSDLQLHYVFKDTTVAAKQLVIFLHGFPDSCFVYRDHLLSPHLRATGAQLVSLDLPSFGGSDGLHRYGASNVMNAIAEVIDVLKRQYLTEGSGSCVLVGHDWGGAIASRVAAETTGLVDRVVLINTAYTPSVKREAETMIQIWKARMSDWSTRPWELGRLWSAWGAVEPVRAQLLKSSYIFMFSLPMAMLAAAPSRPMKFLLDFCIRQGHHKTASHLQHRDIALSQASCYGPGTAECTTHTEAGDTYSPSVLARAGTDPPGDWLQRIRLYREGLALGRWKLSVHLQQYAFSPDKSHQFTCPVTVIFGLQDPALEPTMVLDGMEQYFRQSPQTGLKSTQDADLDGLALQASHIVRLPTCGHWSPLERPLGTQVLETTLVWALSAPDMREGLHTMLKAEELSVHHVLVDTYS